MADYLVCAGAYQSLRGSTVLPFIALWVQDLQISVHPNGLRVSKLCEPARGRFHGTVIQKWQLQVTVLRSCKTSPTYLCPRPRQANTETIRITDARCLVAIGHTHTATAFIVRVGHCSRIRSAGFGSARREGAMKARVLACRMRTHDLKMDKPLIFLPPSSFFSDPPLPWGM
jgi:hypothetical protein